MDVSRCVTGLLLSAFLAGSLHSQTTTLPDSDLPTIQSKVRLVLVDLVATNSKDDPIPGLHKEDFQVFENGRPQTILSFEEHVGVPPAQDKSGPSQPNVFSNDQALQEVDSVNILLLDWLNTQPQDQGYVRAQTIKYLKNIAPGTRMAIFTLGAQLHMVQGFTSDSTLLLAALNTKDAKGGSRSSLLSTDVQRDTEREIIAQMVINQTAPIGVDAVRQVLADTGASRTDERVKLTLRALQQLAHYLSNIPGRKNVIWFSGSFPISVLPGEGAARQYLKDIQRTADLLTPSRVAIYPVSAEGLYGNTTFSPVLRNAPPIREDNAAHFANQLAMEKIAQDTGGKAFYNVNGLGDVVGHIVKNASRYYTLTYTPTDNQMDGSYRSIQIKPVRVNYKLSYRRGYFSENAKAAPAPQAAEGMADDPLLPLMAYGLPDFAQVIYKMRVAPSNPQPAPEASVAGDNFQLTKPVTRFGVDLAVSVDDLKLQLAPEGTREGSIEVMIVAYDSNGRPLNWAIRTTKKSLDPEKYAAAQSAGLQFHEDIDVPQENVYLRTGVYALGANRAGTLGIPLSDGKSVPAAAQ